MALIDFSIYESEIKERNALIYTARELLFKAREAAKNGSDWKEIPDHSKAVTKFLNESSHLKYENDIEDKK